MTDTTVDRPDAVRNVSRPSMLTDRQRTHGEFKKNAEISQRIKKVYADAKLSDVHREALDQISLKISRILSGKSNFRDHWDDIAGYAKLGSEACE